MKDLDVRTPHILHPAKAHPLTSSTLLLILLWSFYILWSLSSLSAKSFQLLLKYSDAQSPCVSLTQQRLILSPVITHQLILLLSIHHLLHTIIPWSPYVCTPKVSLTHSFSFTPSLIWIPPIPLPLLFVCFEKSRRSFSLHILHQAKVCSLLSPASFSIPPIFIIVVIKSNTYILWTL